MNLWSPKPPDLYCASLTSHWQRNGGQRNNDYYFGVFSLLFWQRTPLLRFTASSRRPFPNRCPPSPLRKGKVRKNKKQKKVNQSAKFILLNLFNTQWCKKSSMYNLCPDQSQCSCKGNCFRDLWVWTDFQWLCLIFFYAYFILCFRIWNLSLMI